MTDELDEASGRLSEERIRSGALEEELRSVRQLYDQMLANQAIERDKSIGSVNSELKSLREEVSENQKYVLSVIYNFSYSMPTSGFKIDMFRI